jgi:hypothetical protein
LTDNLAKEKPSHTIPRTKSLTFSALIAKLEGFSTRLLDAIDHDFKGFKR